MHMYMSVPALCVTLDSLAFLIQVKGSYWHLRRVEGSTPQTSNEKIIIELHLLKESGREKHCRRMIRKTWNIT